MSYNLKIQSLEALRALRIAVEKSLEAGDRISGGLAPNDTQALALLRADLTREIDKAKIQQYRECYGGRVSTPAPPEGIQFPCAMPNFDSPDGVLQSKFDALQKLATQTAGALATLERAFRKLDESTSVLHSRIGQVDKRLEGRIADNKLDAGTTRAALYAKLDALETKVANNRATEESGYNGLAMRLDEHEKEIESIDKERQALAARVHKLESTTNGQCGVAALDAISEVSIQQRRLASIVDTLAAQFNGNLVTQRQGHDALSSRIATLAQRLTEVRNTPAEVETRLTKLEQAHPDAPRAACTYRLDGQNTRIDDLQKEVAAFRTRTAASFDEVERRLRQVEREVGLE